MAVRNAGTRQDTFRVIVHLNGNSFGVWDKKSGGELDSDETRYSPGGMLPQISLGGRKQTGNVTLSRLYDRKDDHDRINTLFNAVGKGKVTISQRPMDPDGNAYGRPIIYNGTLKRVTVPDVDSESSTAAMIEIEVTVSGYPAAT